MKKIAAIMVLGIILIGTGAKSKLGAQFPYQLDVTSGSQAAVRAMVFSPREKTLDEFAEDMGEQFAWSAKKTATGSSVVSVGGAANVDFLSRYTSFSIDFHVLPDGGMRVDSAMLNDKKSDMDQVVQMICRSAEQMQNIARIRTPKVTIRGDAE